MSAVRVVSEGCVIEVGEVSAGVESFQVRAILAITTATTNPTTPNDQTHPRRFGFEFFGSAVAARSDFMLG